MEYVHENMIFCVCVCRTAFIQRGDIQTATIKSKKGNRVVNEIIGALTPERERERKVHSTVAFTDEN